MSPTYPIPMRSLAAETLSGVAPWIALDCARSVILVRRRPQLPTAAHRLEARQPPQVTEAADLEEMVRSVPRVAGRCHAWWLGVEMDQLLQEGIGAGCARSNGQPPLDRGGIESTLSSLYLWWGFESPLQIFWAASPLEAETMLAIVEACDAACSEAGLDFVQAYLASQEVRGAAAVSQMDELVFARARLNGRRAPHATVDVYAEQSLAARERLIREFDIDTVEAVSRIAFDRAGTRRADAVITVGDVLGWYGKERPRWRRPMPLRWFSPESIDAFAIAGSVTAERWRKWGDLVRSVFTCWLLNDLVVVCPLPELHSTDPAGRLHNESGPALRWSDGWSVFAWHGTVVPSGLIEHSWSSGAIAHHPNAEVRRCAIERMGWDSYIGEAGLLRVGAPVQDPGNPGQMLELYDVPGGLLGERSARVLLCTNASLERDGTRRRYALYVPPLIHDPISAIAWTFGIDPHDYLTLPAAS